MAGICGSSVKRSPNRHLALAFFKNRAWSVSRQEEAWVTGPHGRAAVQEQQRCRHERVQVGGKLWNEEQRSNVSLLDSAFTPPHQPNLPAIITTSPTLLSCTTLPGHCFSDWLFIFFFRVEFQNKFYSGQGFKFLPFTFESILDGRFEEWALTLLLLMSPICCESVWLLYSDFFF